MIPFKIHSKPLYFDIDINKKGNDFLKSLGRQPTNDEWSRHDYWSHCRDDLYDLCHGICCYTGMRINRSHNTPNVEHYYPKRAYPEKAYEWENYRILSPLLNSTKKDRLFIIDAADLEYGDVIIEFPSLRLTASPKLKLKSKRDSINYSIKKLNLNKIQHRRERFNYCCMVASGIPIDFLNTEAPIFKPSIEYDRKGFESFLDFIKKQIKSYKDCLSCSKNVVKV